MHSRLARARDATEIAVLAFLIGRRTERLKTRCAINARVGFRLLAVSRDILQKCGDLHHEKRFKISRLQVPY
jgi:hypothetical protein